MSSKTAFRLQSLGSYNTDTLVDRTRPSREYRNLQRCSRRDLILLFERIWYDGDLIAARWFEHVFEGHSLI